jgi:hypothetical protein
MLPRAMCSALYRLIRVAIKMAHDEGTFVRQSKWPTTMAHYLFVTATFFI